MADIVDLTEELDQIIATIDNPTITAYQTTILKGRVFYNQPTLNDNNAYDHNKELNVAAPGTEANLISSKATTGNYHYPVIDMDYDVFLVSSSPGKNHLIINKAVTEEKYLKVLVALQEAGLVQAGIVNQFKKKKATFIRRFSITKGNVYVSNVAKGKGGELFRAYKILHLTKQILEKIISNKDKLIESQRQEILELKSQIGNQTNAD